MFNNIGVAGWQKCQQLMVNRKGKSKRTLPDKCALAGEALTKRLLEKYFK